MSISIRQSTNICTTCEAAFADLGFSPSKRVFVKTNLCGWVPVK